MGTMTEMACSTFVRLGGTGAPAGIASQGYRRAVAGVVTPLQDKDTERPGAGRSWRTG